MDSADSTSTMKFNIIKKLSIEDIQIQSKHSNTGPRRCFDCSDEKQDAEIRSPLWSCAPNKQCGVHDHRA